MKRFRGILAAAVIVAPLVGSIGWAAKAVPASRIGGAPVEDTMAFRLSEGEEEAHGSGAVPRPPVQDLTEAETAAVLRRLPPFETAPDERGFALREGSLPPPRTGRTVTETFPPVSTALAPEMTEAGPLRLLRHSPDGDVPIAPTLSATFSQPMVAVSSVEAATRESLPVVLTPQPPGEWRWIGTKTVLFEPDGRFPMATDYKAAVRDGTRSATGGVLDRGISWTFTTPAPRLGARYPENGPVRRDAVFFAGFDQRVDPAAVLPTIRATGSPGLRLATSAEIEADTAVARLVKNAEPGRFVAFRADALLPGDSDIEVTIGPGTPSAEGPKKTTDGQSWSVRTYGPMRVASHRCGWNDECRPFTPWNVEFTNPIDAKTFRKEMLRVEPELPGLKIAVYGQSLSIRGLSKGRTTYRVTLGASIPDAFGQTLGDDTVRTFTVGAAIPTLTSQGDGDVVVLDPFAPPRFTVYSVNHDALKVRLHTVTPEDWTRYREWRRTASREPNASAPPGTVALTKTLPVQAVADELTETRIDLSPVLDRGHGHVIVVVEPVRQPKGQLQRVVAWVQATAIGLDAFVDGQELVAWATSLRDGRPVAGAAITTLPAGPTATTGDDGLARLPLDAVARGGLVARLGTDVALLSDALGWWSGTGSWQKQEAADALRFSVFDDRGLYRPGEEVKVKGWARRLTPGPAGDVLPVGDGSRRLRYTLSDSQGNEIAKGERPVSALGGFDLVLKLPPTMNLGTAALRLDLEAGVTGRHQHPIPVQEFRRPEFEVSASASDGPHFVGDHATATVAASYFAGGGLPDAEVRWRVSAAPGRFVPPNRDDYSFGTWTPWWSDFSPVSRPTKVETFTARTDGTGRHRLRIDFDAVTPPRPTSLTAEATIQDVNRQAWTASARWLVHPASLYVGLKTTQLFVQPGEPIDLKAIVVDLDGRAVASRPIRVRAERVDWEQEGGEWKETLTDAQECRVASGSDAVACRFQARQGGTHRISARVEDDRGRPNETLVTVWVAGGTMPPKRTVEQEVLTLVPDKKDYRPGETARVLVLSPFSPAEGLLTLRRSGLVRTERFRMTGTSHTLAVPITEALLPNVHMQVDLVGAAERTDDGTAGSDKQPKRPAYATGHLNLPVPPATRTLAVSVIPKEKALAPGGRTSVDVQLRDASGRPVAGAEVAVIVVDEAVLALTGYALPDPLAVFYARHEPGVRDHHSRSLLLLAQADDLQLDEQAEQRVPLLSAAAPQAAPPPPAERPSSAPRLKSMVARDGAEPEPIRMRTDFSALALFEANVPTDARGLAHVDVTLPDNLTRYRVMAVAAAPVGGRLRGNEFGSGESTITARLPIMIRPSPPRFLNFGDRFELPVVLQNQTDAAITVDVAARASNADFTLVPGRRVSVPANDRVEVRFPAAARRAGTARFQVGAAAGAWADAAEVHLPVWTPATTEAVATYGQIDEGALRQPVAPPPDAVADFGGLEITTSSTALQALTDAVLYLVAYPFECAEQLSSRILAVAALRDVLTAFEAEGLPEPEEMVAALKRDVDRLRAMQNGDGGFGFWRRGEESWPYVSIHVAHALARAKEKGFDVPSGMLESSKEYLKQIEKRMPSTYDLETRRTLEAYALYVRQRLGDADPGRARQLIRDAGGVPRLSFEALGWLLPVVGPDKGAAPEADAIRAHFANRVSETAAAAHFAVSYGDGAHLLLHSDRRADAIVLEALIGDQPKNDLIPKLVEGLLGHRKAGRWGNTQENAFVLLALDRYFNTYEKTTPNFVARVWLGKGYAGEHAFRGRTTERHHVDIPMRALGTGPSELTLAKDGPGRLYYRVGMRYAPESLTLQPADRGFTIERAYESVDRTGDVARDADGTWRLKAGSRVRVTLTMVAPGRRTHVALVDPLPAGLEALNPALATTAALPPGNGEDVALVGATGLGGPRRPGHWWLWTRPWYEHQNLRDERVEAFASLLFEGVYRYSYVARATTPGAFVVPPAKAEEMYHPETFGRSGTDRVIVE